MAKDNLKKEIGGVESVKGPESGDISPEGSKGVNDEVLKKIGEEVGGIEDGGQAVSDILQEIGDGNPEVVKIEEESREIVNEAMKSSDEVKRKADDIINAESPTAFEILDGREEKLKELDSEIPVAVEELERLENVEINEANINEVQKSVDDFGKLVRQIKSEAVALVSFEKENKAIDKETVDKYNRLVDYYGNIKNKVIPASVVELYNELEVKINDYKEQEKNPTTPKPIETEAGTDEVADDVEDDVSEVAGSAKEKTEEGEQDYEREITDRTDEWKKMDESEKRKEMETYRNRLIEETKNIGKSIEELREELDENLEKRSEAAKKLSEQLNSGAEISGLEMFEQEKIKEALKELMVINGNNLNIAKLEYLAELPETGGDFDSLMMNRHKGKEISIEELEIMADDAENYYDYLEEFERMKEGEQEEIRKEVKGILERFGDAIRDDPELRKKLIAAGIIAALLVLAAGVGIMAGPEIAALVTAENAIKVLAGAGALASIGVLVAERKRIGKALWEGGKIGAGGLIGGALMLAGWMLDEENRDKVVKAASGLNFPSWYVTWKKFLGLGEENESKS